MAGFWQSVGRFFGGSKEKHKRVSTLRPEQEGLYNQLQQSAMGPGAGGAYGQAADYYRDLLDPNSQTAQQMFAPETRNFNENIIPQLSEQFAGMGSGGLSSSGFRNAAVNAGTDLSERLGAIRANLRQQGAQGLMNIGNQGLQNYSQDVMTQPGSPGFISQAAPLVSAAAGFALGGPSGAAAGYQGGNWLSNAWGGNKVCKNSGPYGNMNDQANSVIQGAGMRR
jgi:hypothetical protein